MPNTFNVGSLTIADRLEYLKYKLEKIKRHTVGFGEVRRTWDEEILLNVGNVI